jgi:hypothetical protein
MNERRTKMKERRIKMKERRIKNLKNNVYGIISSLNLFCQCN